MLRMILKQALARRGRLALTWVAVTLGITFVTGTLILTDTSQRVFDDQFAEANAGVDLTVRTATTFGSAMGVEVERDPVPTSVADRVRATAGVESAIATVKGAGLLIVDGNAVVTNGPSLLQSWTPPPTGPYTIASGRAPGTEGEVALDVATARAEHVDLGDEVTVQANRSATLRVVGLVRFGASDGVPNSTLALVAPAEAGSLLDIDDAATEVQVVATAGTDVNDLRTRLATALGPEYEVVTSRDIAAASADAAQEQLAYIRVTLLVLAGAALLIGAFLIANTFAIVITQRTKEIAVLRAAGATSRQVLASVLGEAALLGVAGAVAGVPLGFLAAIGLREMATGLGVAIPDAGLVLLPRTVVIALAVGLTVTLLAAAGPARRAARVAPVQAMRAADPATKPHHRRVVHGLQVGLVAAVLPWFRTGDTVHMALVLASAVLAVIAAIMVGPWLAPWLTRAVGRRLPGVSAALAAHSGRRAPRRTAATVTSLALSLSLIAFICVVAASIRTSIADSFDEVVTADLVVESKRGEMLGGLTPQVAAEVEALPEVEVASVTRYGHWMDGDTTSALTAIDPDTLPAVADLEMTGGSIADLDGPGTIVLANHLAADRHLSVGDRLSMTFARTGEQQLRVVGFVDDRAAQALSTDYLVSLDTYRWNFSERMDASIFVRVSEDVDAAQAKAAVRDALAGTPTAEVRDQAAAVDGRTAMVDQILGLVTVLLLFTVLIAALGITNTLALSIVERTREIGLLRAVGMTRRQLRRMVRAEAALIAVAGLAIGTGLGVALGFRVVEALSRQAPIEPVLPWAQLVTLMVLALVAGIVAGLLPSRRAARMEVLHALASE